eukprot:1849912-Rhodomonas_salina.2
MVCNVALFPLLVQPFPQPSGRSMAHVRVVPYAIARPDIAKHHTLCQYRTLHSTVCCASAGHGIASVGANNTTGWAPCFSQKSQASNPLSDKTPQGLGPKCSGKDGLSRFDCAPVDGKRARVALNNPRLFLVPGCRVSVLDMAHRPGRDHTVMGRDLDVT